MCESDTIDIHGLAMLYGAAMSVKSLRAIRQATLEGPAANDPQLCPIDGQLVVVGLTPAVMRLAHAARAIHEHHRVLETGKAQVPSSSAGATK